MKLPSRRSGIGARASAVAVGLLVSAIFYLPGPYVGAQETAPTGGATALPATAPGDEPAAPAPFGAADFVAEVDRVTGRLRAIVATLPPNPQTRRIEDQLPSTVDRVEELNARLSAPGVSPRSLQEVQDELASWNSVADRLADWNAALTTQVQAVEAVALELKSSRLRWVATRDSAETEGLPASLVDRATETLAALDQTIADSQRARDELLTLQTLVSDRLTVVQAARSALQDSKNEIRRGLFASDAPPIWRSPIEGAQIGDFFAELARAQVARRTPLRNYIRAQESIVALHAIILVGLVFAFFMFRRRQRILDGESDKSDASGDIPVQTAVLDRPISGAILTAVLFAPFFYPEAPTAFGNLVSVAVLIPATRLLLKLLPRELHGPIFWLIPMFVINRVLEAAPVGSPLVRLLLLGEAGLLLAVIAWPIHRRRRDQGAAPLCGWSLVVHRVVQAGAALVVVSMLANVLGYVVLSSLLVNGVFDSLYLMALLYAAALVLEVLLWGVLRSPLAAKLPMINRHRLMIFGRGRRWIQLGILALFVYLDLRIFSMNEPAAGLAGLVLGAGFGVGEVRFSVGGLLGFVLTLYIAFTLSRLLRFVLEEDVMPRMNLPRGVPQTVSSLANYVILFLGFLLAVSAAGIPLSSLVLVTGALGVGIGFGLQSVVNNFVSGLILLFERPIKPGDIVEFGTLFGRVRRIGIRASSVVTWDGAEVIVPNGNLVSTEVTNWTLSDRLRRIQVKVGVAYGTDPQRVIDLLLEVAAKHEKIITDRMPSAIFDGFGESSLDFTLRAWTRDVDNAITIRSDLSVATCSALAEAGMEIPFPQRDLHLRSVDEAAGASLTGGGPGPAKKRTG